MSRNSPSTRDLLLRELGDEVRANQRATDEIDELVTETLGINRTDARCLDILEQRGRMSAGQLAAESKLSSGAITAVIDRLERAGYAQRISDPDDRRRVLVELTPTAREAAWELMGEPMAAAAAELLGDYNEEQLRTLIDFQRRGRELQERHAEWLRERLPERSANAQR